MNRCKRVARYYLLNRAARQLHKPTISPSQLRNLSGKGLRRIFKQVWEPHTGLMVVAAGVSQSPTARAADRPQRRWFTRKRG